MDILKLQGILLELRSVSIQLNANLSDDNFKKTVDKYGVLFIGGNCNCIYSDELARSIKSVFAIDITNDELNKLIPTVCKTLKMGCEPMGEVGSISYPNPKIACYQITLWHPA
jgi:hypothetical protein